MSALQRPLRGCVVNISVSESDNSAEHGFPGWQVNRVTVQVVAALLGQGVSIVFGHDWREDGVMEAIHGFARQMQPPDPLSPEGADIAGQPLLLNLLPWPDIPMLPTRDLERLNSTLRVEPAGLPTELRVFDDQAKQADPNSPLYRYVRARGLTFLRHRLDEVCHARLCVGGRRAGSAGRYPGIVEEALFALTSNKPLYLAGLLGGAAAQVVDAIEGKQMPDDFCRPGLTSALYNEPPVEEVQPTTRDDRIIDRDAVWRTFRTAGLREIARTNRLTIAQNEELLHTPVLDRVINLVLTGLSLIKANS